MVNQQMKKGKVVLGAELLAHIEGKEQQYKSKHYIAKEFLDRFQRLVLPITFTQFNGGKDYVYTKGKAREGTIDIPQILIDNWNFSIHGSRVYIDSLRDFSRSSPVAQSKLKKERRKLASIIKPISNHQAELLNYLNNLPSNRFKGVLKHMDEATQMAHSLPNEQSKRTTLKQLETIKDNPMPFYSASARGRTERVFGDSFLALPKVVRNILTQDWLELDLEQAQLRILAHWWGCQPVIDFINTGKSLWKELEEYMMQAFPPAYKLSEVERDALKFANKKLIYSTCYGMGLRNLKTNYREHFEEYFSTYTVPSKKQIVGNKYRTLSVGEFICNHPVISSLIGERAKWIHKVKVDGGAYSPYGFVPKLKGMNPAAVLATVAQAYEQKLMEPLLNLCSNDFHPDNRGYKTSRFQVIGWIHDGVILHFQDKLKCTAYLNKLMKEWDILSRELGIPISISLTYKNKKDVVNPNIKKFSANDMINLFDIQSTRCA